jgi:two-component system chemotaxis response regulator CheB
MTDMVNETDFGMVTKSASGGQIALEWLEQCGFDVVLIDVQCIKEIGPQVIGFIKQTYPRTEIILMSDHDPESAKLTLESMNNGALDFIVRGGSDVNSQWELTLKSELEAVFTQIKVRQYLPYSTVDEPVQSLPPLVEVKKHFVGEIDLVLIASSTGGPVALEQICAELPADFGKPVLIVQHMPPEFTAVLATSFNKKFKIPVKEGKAGDVVKPGQVWIAPGGYHMILEEATGKTTTVQLLETPFINGVRPAADVLFQSVAKQYKGRNILVVVLTGMGNDGTAGIKALKEACHCYCITQSEKTCVVYGMPKCVVNEGMSDEVADLRDIGRRINQIASGRVGAFGS